MSLNDVILDHESNQCLFVCTKCGAEYVTRDMLAMHMMDSARAGMCIDSEAINNASTLNKNNSNQKITVCEVLVDSDQACTQKSETSNVFESTHPYASLSNWIGERAEPIFNMLFNQLTLPHIYSLQSPTVNVNTKNNMDSNVFDPVDRKVFSSLEDNIPCVRGLQSNRNTSSSLLDIQKNDGIQCLLMNCKQQANNDSTNIKMNFISSLKGNKNDVFTSSTTRDRLRMTSEKSIPKVNDYEGSAKGNLNEFLFNQTCTLPVYSLIRSLPNYNTSSTSSTNNSQTVNSPTVSESVNDNSKATTNLQCISQRVIKEVHSEEYFKNATVDPQPARYNDLKSLKFHRTFVNFKDCYTTKRSRSLPSPRALRNHQASCEIKTVHGNDVNKLTKISGLKNDDEVLHKIRYDRKCSKKTAYRNIRKIMSYNRSKFSVSQNHIINLKHQIVIILVRYVCIQNR
ncbi:unnamed protein product [Heterobilharzia americana]|nr:unnamed protein product [Heterobilharzia americana]